MFFKELFKAQIQLVLVSKSFVVGVALHQSLVLFEDQIFQYALLLGRRKLPSLRHITDNSDQHAALRPNVRQ